MTPTTLTAAETLFLWRLAVDGGEGWRKDVKPALARDARDRLAAAGLIEVEKRKAPEGNGAPLHLTLADAGWAWIAANIEAELSSRSPAGVDILARLLRALKRYMDRADVPLAELLAPAPPAAGDLSARVAAAYFALSDGIPNVQVRLADIRRRLSDVSREALDRELLRLDSSGRASLYRLDDPRQIGPEDVDAALLTPAGEERHIIYMEASGS